MPIVERLARIREPQLSPAGVRYTRKVTKVWCSFYRQWRSRAVYRAVRRPAPVDAVERDAFLHPDGNVNGGEWLVRQRVIKTMDKPLPLSQWLNAPRPDETPVARLDDRIWTLGDLRHDVTQLVDALRQEEGERWALCFENGYLFIVALLAALHAVKPRAPRAQPGAQQRTAGHVQRRPERHNARVFRATAVGHRHCADKHPFSPCLPLTRRALSSSLPLAPPARRSG